MQLVTDSRVGAVILTGGTETALRLLRALRGLDFVGGDLVEVSPPFDTGALTAFNGASILFEILCLLAEARARDVMRGATYALHVTLGDGPGRARYLTCDLGMGYVRCNADYRS